MFKVGDVVKVKHPGVKVFGCGELIVSRVENHIEQGFKVVGEPEQWISIVGFPQEGSHTYMSSVFEKLDLTLENK